jgi:hypothetical protein
MRDSITYNLNYFIMRMSGTKPLKNTMRKSPIKQEMANNATELKTNPDVTSTNNNRSGVGIRGKKVSGYVGAAKKTATKNTKPVSAETTARREASKKSMDTYIKVNKSKRALKAAKK